MAGVRHPSPSTPSVLPDLGWGHWKLNVDTELGSARAGISPWLHLGILYGRAFASTLTSVLRTQALRPGAPLMPLLSLSTPAFPFPCLDALSSFPGDPRRSLLRVEGKQGWGPGI